MILSLIKQLVIIKLEKMFKILKSIFSDNAKKSKPYVEQSMPIDLDAHSQCPKYVSFATQAFHYPIEKKGIFKMEAMALRDWMIKRDRGRSQFELQFTKWLG